jgi:membrane associated rhomboid family serine protease
MGVIGAYVVLGLRRRLPIAPVVALLVLNLIIGFTGGIDWRAHLGGLTTGAVLALVYDMAGNLRDRTAELAITVGASAAVLAVLALLLTGIAPGHVNLS